MWMGGWQRRRRRRRRRRRSQSSCIRLLGRASLKVVPTRLPASSAARGRLCGGASRVSLRAILTWLVCQPQLCLPQVLTVHLLTGWSPGLLIRGLQSQQLPFALA